MAINFFRYLLLYGCLKLPDQESLYFNEYFVFIEPVTKIPECCPGTKTGHYFNCQFTSPRKKQFTEGIENINAYPGTTKMAEHVNKNAIHANNNKEQ
jgi:hypothetical protein